LFAFVFWFFDSEEVARLRHEPFKEVRMQRCYCKYIIPTVHTNVESVALDNFSLKVMESVNASPARLFFVVISIDGYSERAGQ